MDFRVNQVSIENFRAIEKIETKLWNETIVSGDNECSKSSFVSAILWCLTGKDIENNSTFEIVPIGKYGKVNPTVTLECVIGDKPVTLKREYKAKFTRDKQFSDYSVVTYINGIETGVRKFQEWVTANICNEQVFKILSNPKTFAEDCPKEPKELMWQAQRRLLIGIIGEQKTDLELAQTETQFKDLVEHLKRYDSATQYLTFAKKQYSETQKELDSFSVRVEQQEKNIMETTHTEAEIEQLVTKIKKQASDLKAQNESFKRADRSNQADLLKQEIQSKTNQIDSLLKQYNEDMQVYERTKTAYQNEADKCKNELDEAFKKIKTYTEAIEKLKTAVVVEVCETCGQKLTKYAIENSKRKLEERIKSGEKQTANLSNQIIQLKSAYETNLGKSRTIMQPTYPAIVDKLKEDIMVLTNNLSEISVETNMQGYEESMKQLESEMDSLKEEYFKIKHNKECGAELQKIKEENRETAKKLSDLQRMVDITKDFISFKCLKHENEINNLFENVTFQLFEKNKSNDEVKETCVMRYKGVKYDDLSYSTKVIAAIEIVKAFQKFYNVTVPLFIDNGESITGELNANTQTITMKVVEEKCPKCNGESGRRNSDGTWTCKKCGHVWKKKLEILEA